MTVKVLVVMVLMLFLVDATLFTPPSLMGSIVKFLEGICLGAIFANTMIDDGE